MPSNVLSSYLKTDVVLEVVGKERLRCKDPRDIQLSKSATQKIYTGFNLTSGK